MKYLVDANVLSETTKPFPDANAISWLRHHEQDIVVDPVILGEIQFGILLLPKGKRRQRLERWFSQVVLRVSCLAWDAATGIRWASLLARLRSTGHAMPVKDSLIAATALQNDLTVATRNTNDFKKSKVRVVNPFLGQDG
jgi:predicted nucleic acid-binding protein